MGVCSVSQHDATMSFEHISYTPFPQKFIPTCTGITITGAPICPSTAYQGAKTLCLHDRSQGALVIAVSSTDAPQSTVAVKFGVE
jgi:hypothetical protein